MSKLLTTGEMIDKLKTGQRAVGKIVGIDILDDIEMEVFKDETGHIKEETSKETMSLTAGFINSIKWRILPGYVSFEEAMQANRKGKSVYYHGVEGEEKPAKAPEHYIRTDSTNLGKWSLYNLYIGKWTIEED